MNTLKTMLAVFAALCLLGALFFLYTGNQSFTAGSQGEARVATEGEIKSKESWQWVDPLQKDADLAKAKINDKELVATGQRQMLIGGLLLLPAILIAGYTMKAKNGYAD